MLVSGLRLDDLGTEALSWLDLRAFVAYPAPTSAIVRCVNPDGWITPEIALLRKIEHAARVLAWQQTEDGHANPPRNYPEQIPLTEAEQATFAASRDEFEYDVLPIEELAARIGWSTN